MGLQCCNKFSQAGAALRIDHRAAGRLGNARTAWPDDLLATDSQAGGGESGGAGD
jgi:hypothetical protein